MNIFRNLAHQITIVRRLAVFLLLVAFIPKLQAQWLTQSIALTNGWNAVFLHVDASHSTLDTMVAGDVTNPILEVWRWNPSGTVQFVSNPQEPVDTGSQWISWVRDNGASTLRKLVGNSAYLVKVGNSASTYTWTIKGKPVAPLNDWTTKGLNFVGFSTTPTTPPTFETFLARSPELQQNAEIYYYRGGELGAGNPARLFAFRTASVKRGQAFWIRSGSLYNTYFGPFDVELSSGVGVDFKENRSSSTFRLKNLTTNSLTVTVNLVASEASPSGEVPISAMPPLLIRGDINLTNLTYGYTNLPVNTARSWTLAPKGQSGSEKEVVLGLNRSAITNSTGSLLAGILRFSDSLGQLQVNVPVSATVGSVSGLWVGKALVTQVGEYLKTYERNAQGQLVISAAGHYIATETNTSLGDVARPYPLRLIVHNPDAGTNAVLFQRIFFGPDANTNLIVVNKESRLNRDLLNNARRISATHLPFTEANAGWSFNGRLGDSTNLTATITLDYNDQASNPFLHTYHPDHDNLNATFKNVLAQGSESYGIKREVTLNALPPSNDFSSLISSTETINGDYVETVSLLGLARAGGTNDTRQFQTRGVFTLKRISDISTVTIVP